jgi:hypothetical protein
MYRSPEGQKLFWKIAADAGKDASGALLKDLASLDKMASKYEKEHTSLRPVDLKSVDLSKYQFAD